ncbi:hypothetical protein ACP3WD_25395, partial [Salmonella enterica]|uniref:hypothetical protein n=1 Tax=Salmonella enterica TaxID=28901 RepID=UPI003CEA766A
RAVDRVGAVRRLEDAVERVMRQLALRAPDFPADEADGFELGQQILAGLVDVQHAVDGLAGRMLARQHQRL